MPVTYFHDLHVSSCDLQGYFQKIGHRQRVTVTDHIIKPSVSANNDEE